MADDRLQQIRRYAEGDYLGAEAPDLGPLRTLAETGELAEAVARLADAHGRPLMQMICWRRWPARSRGR